jgi:XTP/dITP diphosphohydrolase
MPPDMVRILLATNNPGKLEELRSLLGSFPGIELVSPDDIGLSITIKESGADYRENAIIKAKAFAEASGLPSLADDSGLEVEALHGAPGLQSARIAPTAGERRALLLRQLASKPRPWWAVFHSTIALAMPDGDLHVAEGECRGEISPVERGQGGFGYDPIFIVDGTDRTMAELSMEEKNRLSHRAKAIEGIKIVLKRSSTLR